MTTGWLIEDSSGGFHKSWGSAIEAHHADPTLRFFESTLDMGGHRQVEVTSEVRRRADLDESEGQS